MGQAMDQALRDQIVSIIDDVSDMTIATIREDGYPQATTVSYVSDGLTIYFGTEASSQKARNIARNNKVSLTIDRDYDNWETIEGLSMAAVATPVTDPEEAEKIEALMVKKFPQIVQYVPEHGNEADLALFRIDPKIISLLDYSKGFGHTELIEL